jgi:hypothetical protein
MNMTAPTPFASLPCCAAWIRMRASGSRSAALSEILHAQIGSWSTSV